VEVDQLSLDHTLAVAREALGVDAFTAEWTTGRTCPLELTVDQVLELVPEV
jgi:hypothetical protein